MSEVAHLKAGIARDAERWISSRPALLPPVHALGKLFRRLFLTGLPASHAAGRLAFYGSMALPPLLPSPNMRDGIGRADGRQRNSVIGPDAGLVYRNIRIDPPGGRMTISWQEPACLVRMRAAEGGDPAREIVAEGSFAQVAEAFCRFRASQWPELIISFTERRQPPFRYDESDFGRHVLGRLLGIGGK